MTEAAAAPGATPAPWHTGIESEIIGHWQAKGWDISDPKIVATEATRAYKGVEKFIGTDPSQMLRVPKDATDTAGWKAFYQRLGAPSDAKEYDFSAVKHVNDKAPDASLVEAIRGIADQFHVPKDRAADLLKAVIKHMDDGQAAALATSKAALDAERATLDKSWGLNKEINRLEALKGANKLGFTAEDVSNLEKSVGYAKTMEALRRVGVAGREADFVEGGAVNGRPATNEAAAARRAQLMNDDGFNKRYLAGDVQAVNEMRQLNAQIEGYDPEAFGHAISPYNPMRAA